MSLCRTPSLIGALLNFRVYNIIFVGDIEQAFLHISLHPNHLDYVRFMRYKDVEKTDFESFENKELKKCRISRVLFGVAFWCGFLVWLFGVAFWSFLLFSTITHHKGKCNHDPDFFKKILCLLHVSDPNSRDVDVTSGFEFFCICSNRLTWIAWLR